MKKKRYMALVEYDGTLYYGWQALKDNCLPTVQGKLEAAISKVANENIQIVAAGRTDAKVHAYNQVIHFDTYAIRELDNWLLGINTYLPPDISVTRIAPAPFWFHARHKALTRSYRYIIVNSKIPPGLYANNVTWFKRKLDLKKMQLAAQCLIGEHDFNAFRTVHCQAKNSIKKIYNINLSQHEKHITLNVKANGFLHHMVRNIVGALLEVGTARKSIHWVSEVLKSKKRCKGGVTAPASGLYFVCAEYSTLDFETPHEHHDFFAILNYLADLSRGVNSHPFSLFLT